MEPLEVHTIALGGGGGAALPAAAAAALRREGAVVVRAADAGVARFLSTAGANFRAFFALPAAAKAAAGAAARAPYYASARREWVHATAASRPAALPRCGDACAPLFAVCRRVATAAARAVAPALGALDAGGGGDASVLDVFAYVDGASGMGAHTDPGLVTVAWADGPGLEVATRGAFAPAFFGADAFVVFGGDALADATGLAAAPHRVARVSGNRLACVFELRRAAPDET